MYVFLHWGGNPVLEGAFFHKILEDRAVFDLKHLPSGDVARVWVLETRMFWILL